MTVEEVQAKMAELKLQIQGLVQEFEMATGCIVHSIPIYPGFQVGPVTVDVKVQIP